MGGLSLATKGVLHRRVPCGLVSSAPPADFGGRSISSWPSIQVTNVYDKDELKDIEITVSNVKNGNHKK